jgi:hypothetical protein
VPQRRSHVSQNDYADPAEIDEELMNPTDKRMFAIANAFAKGYTVDQIHQASSIDRWFLSKLKGLSDAADVFRTYTAGTLPVALLTQAKQLGFSDRQMAKFLSSTELAVRSMRKEHNIMPFVKQIDTVAAEFPAYTNYLCESSCRSTSHHTAAHAHLCQTRRTTPPSTTSSSRTRASWCSARACTASARRSSSTGAPCAPSARCASAASRRSW